MKAFRQQNLFIFFGAVVALLLTFFSSSLHKTSDKIACNYQQGYTEHSSFYQKGDLVEIINTDENHSIYYTLDGSQPIKSSFRYSQPFSIFPEQNKIDLSLIPTSPKWKQPIHPVLRGVVLRCASYCQKYGWGPVQTKTCLFYRHRLPVVSLAIDPDDFFGFENGIYHQGRDYVLRNYFNPREKWWEAQGNYQRRGKEHEKWANVEFIDTAGFTWVNTDAGVRINGQATRGFAQKSLRLVFKKSISKRDLGFNNTPENKLEIKNYILRNSGNDWGRTMFNDAIIQDLCAGLGFETHTSEPVVVYINGEYWGIHNICERTDENYVAKKYGVKKKKVIYLENTLGIKPKSTEAPTLKHLYQQLQSPSDDTVKIRLLKQVFDYKGFVNYLAAELFFANRDWPGNNLKIFAVPDSERGIKWGFIMHDMDLAFGYGGIPASYQVDMFNHLNRSTADLAVLYRQCVKIKAFRTDLHNAILRLIENELAPSRTIRKIERYMKLLAPEMQYHINRWRKPTSLEQWGNYCDMMKDFALKRPDYLRQQAQQWLK